MKDVVNSLELGRIDADLGGGVYKERVARSGGGKSGGYRAIVFFKSGDRAFFVYGFAKSDRGNSNDKQLRLFQNFSFWNSYPEFSGKPGHLPVFPRACSKTNRVLEQAQLKDFKTTAKSVLSYTDQQLVALIKTNWFKEIF